MNAQPRYGATLDPHSQPAVASKKDEQLLNQPLDNPDKVSGKAWGRIKNIFTRKSQYPTSVFFILGAEFCERFTYYGLRTVLVLYLTGWLGINKNTSTALFHLFSFLAYFCPILGAIIADGYLGRYRTILYISMVYSLGCTVLSLTALPPPEIVGPMIGLSLIALGTGGIKPCVVTFGGEQFSQDQAKERDTFFSAFYFMINLGSLLSTFLTPILRADVHCIEDSCYPLAFGVPALLMFIAIVIFFAGRKRYKHTPVTGSLFSRVFSCITHGISMRFKYKKYQEQKTHWLDYAGDKFEMPFIEDVKRLLKVLMFFLPLPMFWALFNQQGSRWTLQAAELDGSMGVLGRLKPDQLQALNPLLVLFLIPVFERCVYPALQKCRVPNRPIQRMVAGMIFGILAFCVAGFLQLKIEKDAPVSDSQAGYTVINTAACDVIVRTTPPTASVFLHPNSVSEYQVTGSGVKVVTASCTNQTSLSNLTLPGGKSSRLVITPEDGASTLRILLFPDERSHSSSLAGVSVLNLLHHGSATSSLRIVPDGSQPTQGHSVNATMDAASQYTLLDPGQYTVYLCLASETGECRWVKAGDVFMLDTGGVYSVVLTDSQQKNSTHISVYRTETDRSYSMALMVPQYFIITIAEILVSISGLSFAYTQAPESMRSVVQAAWLLTTAFGDLIVVLVAEIRLVPNQSAEFFLFAALMAADTVVFAVVGCFYTYAGPVVTYDDTDEDKLVETDREHVRLQDKKQ